MFLSCYFFQHPPCYPLQAGSKILLLKNCLEITKLTDGTRLSKRKEVINTMLVKFKLVMLVLPNTDAKDGGFICWLMMTHNIRLSVRWEVNPFMHCQKQSSRGVL